MKRTVRAISKELDLPVELPEGVGWEWFADMRAEYIRPYEWVLDDIAGWWWMKLSEDGKKLVITRGGE